MKRSNPNLLFTILVLWVVTLVTACAGSPTSEPTPEFQVLLPSLQPTSFSPPSDAMGAETEPAVTTVPVETFKWFGTNPNIGTLIEGTESTLVRMPHGVYMTFKTSGLTPGDAVTIWWVIYNKPENCSNGECGLDDVFMADESGQILFNESGAPLPNMDAREAVGFSSLRADGKVIENNGSADFRGHLPIGDVTESYAGPGLLDPMNAEFHLLARTHGPAIPGSTHLQLNSDWGGCPEKWKDPCADLQAAVHRPPEH
ncbi:MAG TPA: hypothetical protein VF177_18150 [Anaerolineae bacterium]